ncbi:MAG: ECF-type sigma factor [Egibacteraceae bacterium]
MPDDRGSGPRNRAEDQCQLAALQAANFRGPVWERLAERLADCAFLVIKGWIETGQVFTRMQEKSRQLRLHPPSDGRTLTGDVATELACETVGRAVRAFRIVLEKEGWSAAGGASLQTFFNGQCLFCFPNVYRRWLGETRPPPWQEVQILEDLTEADCRYGQRDCADPAERAERQLGLEEAERRLCEELDPRTAFVLHKREEGYKLAEIAEMLGVTPRVVERFVAKHRQWQQQRGKPEEEAS